MPKSFNYYRNKKVAVSGASGFIGSYLLNEVNKHSKLAYGLSRRKTKIGKLKFLKVDLNNKKSVEKLVKKFDIFFHFASNTNLSKAEENPQYNFDSNVRPIINIVECSARIKKKIKIIFASTGTVYGLSKKKFVNENEKTQPVTIYDKHKLLVEKILKVNTQFNVIDSVSLRIQSVYGESLSKSKDKTRGVLNKIINESIDGKTIQLYGKGNYYRNYIHIKDLVNGILFAGINKKVNGMALNIGTSKLLKFFNVCKMIQGYVLKLRGKKVKIFFIKWPKKYRLIDKRKYILDCNKFKKLTKWNEEIPINKGLMSTIKFFDSSNNVLKK